MKHMRFLVTRRRRKNMIPLEAVMTSQGDRTLTLLSMDIAILIQEILRAEISVISSICSSEAEEAGEEAVRGSI